MAFCIILKTAVAYCQECQDFHAEAFVRAVYIPEW